MNLLTLNLLSNWFLMRFEYLFMLLRLFDFIQVNGHLYIWIIILMIKSSLIWFVRWIVPLRLPDNFEVLSIFISFFNGSFHRVWIRALGCLIMQNIIVMTVFFSHCLLLARGSMMTFAKEFVPVIISCCPIIHGFNFLVGHLFEVTQIIMIDCILHICIFFLSLEHVGFQTWQRLYMFRPSLEVSQVTITHFWPFSLAGTSILLLLI